MRALRWILEALEPSERLLARARTAAGEAGMGSRGSAEQTARVSGPGGTVVIPLRLVGTKPTEVAHLDQLVRSATQTGEEKR